ncbi:hypothetical protein Syun_014914 [Stephania yunnanensis]|uniref:Uncharacterized protein n=1 Tax=Stephania yunnanensis TaxID=152371 RepID=A0AAP0JKK0_9MAGN
MQDTMFSLLIYMLQRHVEPCKEGQDFDERKRVIKDLGYDLIEINGKLQAFRVGDKSHPRSREIFEEAGESREKVEGGWFCPDDSYCVA